MIQDTSFIIDILREDEDALTVLDLLERESQPQKVSAITVLELHEGLVQQDNPHLEQVLEVLRTKHVLDADRTVMRTAGTISGELITQGVQIDREDCIIAATALLQDEHVLTRNVDNFERVEGLSVRSY